MNDRDTIDNELEKNRHRRPDDVLRTPDLPGEDLDQAVLEPGSGAVLTSDPEPLGSADPLVDTEEGLPDEIPILEQDQNTYSPGAAETAHGALRHPTNFDEVLSGSGEPIGPDDTIDESEDEYTR